MRRFLNALFVGAALSCFIVGTAGASGNPSSTYDWPEWRGPNRDGISQETGLLKSWPAGGPKLAWKAKGLGQGYATVAVAGSRIFTLGDKGPSNYVIALNRADGQILWSARVGRSGAPGWGGYKGPRSTPTVDGDLVFAIGQYGEMVCLDAATGKEHWRQDFEKDFDAPLPEWGFSESPLIDGDKVVVTPGGAKGAVVALNKKTGAEVWRCREFTDPAHYSSLITAEIGGVPQYIQLTAQSVAGIAAKDGRLLWKAPRKGATAVIPTPIYHDGHVFVTSGYGIGCNLFKITAANGTFSAEQVYANKVMANHHGGVIRLGNHLYGHSEGKGWTCQDMKTGQDVWQEKSQLGKGSLVYADGHFYLRREDGPGTVALIKATPEGYQETGRFDQPDRSEDKTWAHPVVAGGKLYLRDDDVLLCYDVQAKE